MEYRELEAFVAVAAKHSFTRAAESLSLTQPAVTRQIAALEQEAGAVLLDRLGRRVELTAAGHTLLAYAQEILRLHQEAGKAVGDMTSGVHGRLRVGSSSTAATYLLPPFLRKFHHTYPDVEVGIRTGPSRMIADLVQANEVDIGIVMDYTARARAAATCLAPYASMIIVSPDHPILSRPATGQDTPREIAPSALNNCEFILMQRGASLRAYADEIFAAAAIDVQVTMELDSVEAIKKMIEAGMGMSFLPFMAVEQEVATGRLAALALSGAPGTVRNISVVLRENKHQPNALKEFIALLQAELRGHRSLMPDGYARQ